MSDERPTEPRSAEPVDEYAPTPDAEAARPAVVDTNLLAVIREAVARAQAATGATVTPMVEQHFLRNERIHRLLRQPGPEITRDAASPPAAARPIGRSIDVLSQEVLSWLEVPARTEHEVIALIAGELADAVEEAERQGRVEEHLDLVLAVIQPVAGKPGTVDALLTIARLANAALDEWPLGHVARAAGRILTETAPALRAPAAVITGVALHNAVSRLTRSTEVDTAELDVVGRLAHNLVVLMVQLGIAPDQPTRLPQTLAQVAAVTITDDIKRSLEEAGWMALGTTMPHGAMIVIDELSVNAALVHPDRATGEISALYMLRSLADLARGRHADAVGSLFNAGVPLARAQDLTGVGQPWPRVLLNAMAVWLALERAASFADALAIPGLNGAVTNLGVALEALSPGSRKELPVELVETALARTSEYVSDLSAFAPLGSRSLDSDADVSLRDFAPRSTDSEIGNVLASAVTRLLDGMGAPPPIVEGRHWTGRRHRGGDSPGDEQIMRWVGEAVGILITTDLGGSITDVLSEVRHLAARRHDHDDVVATAALLLDARLDQPEGLARHLGAPLVTDALRQIESSPQLLSDALRQISGLDVIDGGPDSD